MFLKVLNFKEIYRRKCASIERLLFGDPKSDSEEEEISLFLKI